MSDFGPPRKVLLAFITMALSLSVGVAADPVVEKLTGELPSVLAQAGPQELIPVTIVLNSQLTGSQLRTVGAGEANRTSRRSMALEALKAHADDTQAPLRALLLEAGTHGRAKQLRFLWIGNLVAGRLTPDLVREVAAHPDVERLNWNPKRRVFLQDKHAVDPRCEAPAPFGGQGAGNSFATESTVPEVECGTALMQAPRVWDELGNTGIGAVTALIDTGVCWSHSDIVNQIWVNPGEDLDGDAVVMDSDDLNGVDDDGNGYVDDLIGWDFDQMDPDPDDLGGHGSHCAGTIAGDGAGGTAAGVAPGAKVMVLRVGTSYSDEADVWEAMQYAADNGADVISMSLGWPIDIHPDRHTWRIACDNTIDSGTAMVIAAGNDGENINLPYNVHTPGSVPRVIAVGATDCGDLLGSFSSRGPVTWQGVSPWRDHPYPPGLVKPDVSAPGVDTASHAFCYGYTNKSGTSMATPHVAGTVALMVSANPELLHDDIKMILEQSSVDLGDPGKDNEFGSGRVDAYEAVLLSQSSNGTVSLSESAAGCSGRLTPIVADADLQGAGTLNVEIASYTETTPEIVTLAETNPGSGVFRGAVDTGTGPPISDGVIQVTDGDVVTVAYLDADDGGGNSDVPKIASATIDCLEPLITGVETTEISDTSATIRWATDELADSLVTYGESAPPSLQAIVSALVTSHSVELTGLQECTVHYYDLASADDLGNSGTDDDGGRDFRFETYRDSGQGLQSCHAGEVRLHDQEVGCDDVLPVTLVDMDLNLSDSEIDSAVVTMTSTTEVVPEELLLLETGTNTATFTGSMPVVDDDPSPGDGVLQVHGGDVVTVAYHDADDGTGTAVTRADSGVVECEGAAATYIRVVQAADTWAELRVTTSRPTTVAVDWGETVALGNQAVHATFATDHRLTLSRITPCGRVYFRVHATDAHGNGSVFDASGVPFEFNAGRVPGALFVDDFEDDAGWTLEGEWEIGEPLGLGTPPGDPVSAVSGTGVLGHDLSGLGAHPGDFEPSTTQSATSPVIDATDLINSELRFDRKLNVTNGAVARLEAKDPGGTWQEIWATELFGTPHSDSSWKSVVYDISEYADGNHAVQIRFKQQSLISNAFHAGWSVDRLILRDGSLPEFDACGGCGGPAGFGGVRHAEDTDPCAGGGVSLSWNVPPAWGTGISGTYAVYRDTVPDFVPSGANLVVAGLSRTTWTDPSSPPNTPLYYVVRAENDETCSDGPNNGGAMDDNLVRVSVLDETSQTLPGSVGESLRLDPINAVHVRLTWSAAVNAAAYQVYRAVSPQGPLQLVGKVATTIFDDHDQMLAGADAYYKVVAVDACGNAD